MEAFLEILRSVELFADMDDEDIRAVLACLGAKREHVEKKRVIYESGSEVKCLGIVLAGGVQVFQEDFYGNRSIFSNIGPGHLFAESFACAQHGNIPVSVVATEESEILFIDCLRLATPCARACGFHAKLIRNLLNIIARKNIALTQRIEFTSRRTTREKLIAYLCAQSRSAGSPSFTIPFDRQEMADYLCVERSGLSAALSALRDEGVLRYWKNRFELL